MAETFPLSGYKAIGLAIMSGIATRRDRGGLLVTTRRLEPYWAGPITTEELHPHARADIVAFLDDCVDRNLRVDFVHPRFALPRSYTSATWPLADDPEVEAITNGREIVVSGLTAGIILKRGDRLTIMQDDLRCYRSLASDLVVSSAVAQALPIAPRLPFGIFEGGATARFKDPALRLAIVPDSYRNEEVYQQTSITFETEEALA